MRLPLLFDADLVTFLDKAYSAASIAAPGVACTFAHFADQMVGTDES